MARSNFNTPKTKSGKVKWLRFMISATDVKPGTHCGSQQDFVGEMASHWTGAD